jgi:hypothetical protein
MPKNQYDHETLEDLNALIAERSKPENLPKWWKNETQEKTPRVKPNRKPRQRWGKNGRPSRAKKGSLP